MVTKKKQQKKQIHPYIPVNLYELLQLETKRSGLPLHSIVESIITEHFNPEGRKESEDTIIRRLNRLDRELSTVHMELGIVTELVSLFAKNWFIYQPEVPEDQRDELLALQARRFDRFMKNVVAAAANGNKVLETLQQTAFLHPSEIPSELLNPRDTNE